MHNYFIEYRLLRADDAAGAIHDDYRDWLPATLPYTAPVTDGLLGRWNAAPLPDGIYALRLTVVVKGEGTHRMHYVSPIRVQNSPASTASANADMRNADLAVGELDCRTAAEVLWFFGDAPFYRLPDTPGDSSDSPWLTVEAFLADAARVSDCSLLEEMPEEFASVPTGAPGHAPEHARITFPPPVATIRDSIDIGGAVDIEGLHSFYIEFRLLRADNPVGDSQDHLRHWLPATLPRLKPVREGFLGNFNTTVLLDGIYALRLMVKTDEVWQPMHYVSPVRIQNSDYPPPNLSETLLVKPLRLTSSLYGRSAVAGPVALPRGLLVVSYSDTAGGSDGWLTLTAHALTPCFRGHEEGVDEKRLFGNGPRGGAEEAVLKIDEHGCQLLFEVATSQQLEAWGINIIPVEL